MVKKKTWKEFRETGLLWWINMVLHTFGWAIVIDINDDGEVISAYPARVKFRGFAPEINDEGYIKVGNYIKDNAGELAKEAED